MDERPTPDLDSLDDSQYEQTVVSNVNPRYRDPRTWELLTSSDNIERTIAALHRVHQRTAASLRRRKTERDAFQQECHARGPAGKEEWFATRPEYERWRRGAASFHQTVQARQTDPMSRTKMTVQPYQPGTQWVFTTRRGNYTQTEELVLYAEPDGSSMSDDYLPDEADARELWRKWVDKYAVTYHRDHPDEYRLGEVPIYWTVTLPTFSGVFEAAPYAPNVLSENFLTHYTVPTDAETGEPVSWLRLPVLDRGWNAQRADKGGFIQEATGWKPSPLQPTMDVVQIGRAAGVYVPESLLMP